MSNRISAIIVDDEKDACDGLELLVNQLIPNISVISKSENAQNALEIIIDKQPEIVFLDIQMPINDGFWLAEKLNKLKIDICIIFITAYDEYAMKALKHAAFDLLTKPINPTELIESIERYTTNISGNNLDNKLENLKAFLKQERIKIDTKYGFIMVSPKEIIYCEVGKKTCNLHLTNGKTIMATSQLEIPENKLANNSFIKINKSTIINTEYLERYTHETKRLILSDVLQRYEFKADSSGATLLSEL